MCRTYSCRCKMISAVTQNSLDAEAQLPEIIPDVYVAPEPKRTWLMMNSEERALRREWRGLHPVARLAGWA
jgi:hypothetical protein